MSKITRFYFLHRVVGTHHAAAKMSKKLPQTASPLPLVGLIGLLSLGIAGLLRRASATWK